MDLITNIFIKILDLFSTETKLLKTMKQVLFLILILVITFKIINFFIGINLDFNLTKQELCYSIFNKITLISVFTFVFSYAFFKGIIIYFLPNYFLNKKNKISEGIIKNIKKYTFINNMIEKIMFTKNPKKTSRYILEPYVYSIMFLLCLNINIITIFFIIILFIMLLSAGNIISLYNNYLKN